MYSATDLISERDALEQDRSPFLLLAQQIHNVLGPANANLGSSGPLGSYNDTRDTTARRMATFHANGLTSLAFPKHDDFFQADAPFRNPDKAAKRHYHEKAEEMQLMLEDSNFYDEIPNSIWEGGAYGTGLLKQAEDYEAGGAYFAHQSFGTYFIVEDYRKRLIGVFRDVELTVSQLIDFLGDDFKPEELPEKLKQAHEDPRKKSQKFKFLHVIKKKHAKASRGDRVFGDYVIFPEGKTILRETDHEFMPFLMRRHSRFSNWTYGVGPGWEALEDSLQASEASRLFEAFAARTTFPSIRASGDFEGNINIGSGGVTYADPTAAGAGVEAWAMPGDYRAVMELMIGKHRNIESSFAADLFRGLTGESKVYSAMQTQAIENDRNVQLYPSALRLESETGKPMLDNLYKIAEAQGRFKGIAIPDSVRDYEKNPDFAMKPRFRLRSRITTSVRQQRIVKLAQTLDMFSTVFQNDPKQAMRLNWDEIMPDVFRDSGLAESWVKPEEEFQAEIKKIEAEQQALAAAEQAKSLAGAVNQAGGADGVQQIQELAQ